MRSTPLPLILVLLAACTPAMHAPAAPAPAAAPLPAQDDRLLVQQARVELETPHPLQAAEAAQHAARGVGGHVESSIAREDRRVSLVLRVPAPALDSVLAVVGGLGKVEDRRISSLDVTTETADLEARLQNLVAVRDRLRQHLQRAGTIQDVIAVERELARLQTEIDQIEARLRLLRSSVAMSRLSLEIHRPRVLGPVGTVVAGAAWVVEKLFVIE